jgi:hypothetical protein
MTGTTASVDDGPNARREDPTDARAVVITVLRDLDAENAWPAAIDLDLEGSRETHGRAVNEVVVEGDELSAHRPHEYLRSALPQRLVGAPHLAAATGEAAMCCQIRIEGFGLDPRALYHEWLVDRLSVAVRLTSQAHG